MPKLNASERPDGEKEYRIEYYYTNTCLHQYTFNHTIALFNFESLILLTQICLSER